MVSASPAAKPGDYPIGTVPSTVGIIPLSVDEVVIGRAATPGEQPSDVVVDYHVTDQMYSDSIDDQGGAK